MELDNRKRTILNAIIKNYLETGEPVGSRTISKYTDLNLSSATIRNEMADLEEMGLILQPHTSAGRIPSDKGYRLYVDNMMQEKEREVLQMNDFLIQKVDRVELLLKQMAKLLAVNTNYATMISAPQYHHTKLKFIQLSRVEKTRLLAVIVVEGNIIKNAMMNIEEDISDEEILSLNILLNSSLNGLTIDEINLRLIQELKEKAGYHSGVVGSVLEEVANAIKRVDQEKPQIYTSGTTNILKYPELGTSEQASELLTTLVEQDHLAELVEQAGKEHGIQVYIGSETPVQSMKDCSVVTANYALGDGIQGTIGIIGPKRMDYEHVVSVLRTLIEQLDSIYKKE